MMGRLAVGDIPTLHRWLARQSDASPAELALFVAFADPGRLVALNTTLLDLGRELRAWHKAVDLDALPAESESP